MTTKLNPMETKLLNVLWKSSKGLNAFSLFGRLDATFSLFSKATRTLCEEGFIKEEADDFFVITLEGITVITQTNTTKKARPWRDVPNRYLAPKLSVTDFYVPSTRLLDKSIINND